MPDRLIKNLNAILSNQQENSVEQDILKRVEKTVAEVEEELERLYSADEEFFKKENISLRGMVDYEADVVHKIIEKMNNNIDINYAWEIIWAFKFTSDNRMRNALTQCWNIEDLQNVGSKVNNMNDIMMVLAKELIHYLVVDRVFKG